MSETEESQCKAITKDTLKKSARSSMAITVEGHQVALHFANEPNPQVAVQVKQALLGSYFPEKQ